MGIVYLIEPAECRGIRGNMTRVKVGCSEKNNLSRLNRYRTDSIVYCVFGDIQNPRKVETEVLREFDRQFFNAAGREYFDGDLNVMMTVFTGVVLKWRNNTQ